MQKIVILLGLLLVTGSCQGMHQRLGMMEEKKETGQDGLNAWFASFVDVVDNAEEWDAIAASLDQGKKDGYLDKNVEWEDDQYTPLHYAAQEGDLEVVKELIERFKIDADIKTGKYASTPLHLAALEGHLAVVKYLLNHGAKWDTIDKEGSNALHYAASGIKGHENTIVTTYLIEEKKANPYRLVGNEFSLLYLAIKAANIDLVNYIVQELPDLVSMTTCSVSPLAFARAKHEEEIADIIQKKLEEGDGPCGRLSKNCNIH